jgi:hypothetical protein
MMSVLNNLKTFFPIVSYIKIYCINNFKKLPQIFGGSDEEHFYLVTSLTKVDFQDFGQSERTIVCLISSHVEFPNDVKIMYPL